MALGGSVNGMEGVEGGWRGWRESGMCRAQGGESLQDERSLAGAEGGTKVSSELRGQQDVPHPPSLPLPLETGSHAAECARQR